MKTKKRKAKFPLTGIRVIDASRVLAGPFCAQLLADLGAEVIKVERPGAGDETRAWGPPFHDESRSAYYLSCNRNKKSITLALDTEGGRAILAKLIKKSDVLIENFRSESLKALGFTPKQLWKHNGRLLVCSISGFGRQSSKRDVAGYDFMIQALSGFMSITGPAHGEPHKVGVAITDVLTGLYAANAILAHLAGRSSGKKPTRGAHIDMSLLDCAIAAQVNLMQAYLLTGNIPPKQGNAHLQIVPYQVFQTQDSWIVLAVGNDSQFQKFCTKIGREAWSQDPRFARNAARVKNRDLLVPLIAAIMKEATTKEWETQLSAINVAHAPILNYEQIMESPLAEERKWIVRNEGTTLLQSPFQFVGAEIPRSTMPPTLGEHTSEVLSEILGISEKKQKKLKDDGVI